ncbi:pentachlorophenol monooxygenase/3-(3-hydroxy-phenyl)propionate hydroxylase [Prauserella sediminis]|uniref:Pentachlorophenol monooxygenase/3-(3-hydroxy-phenyl)propionate hydroxylase n=1 Tax=Prauserella sediminis TaxID=577680 RepID=A0A839XX41_9PSEU|nr:FAD-dependent monooxygenase [Prauserella sediminis]MBB3665648.1 pentachlorophenol monooxygenase/3-(3-hydroxy-phenyl)propionate hydroxylase [Prauserella sediminis]
MADLDDAVATRGVAVIGAGPVGQTTSLLLARRGVPVVLLDGRPERDPVGSKAICQQRDVLDVWEFAGGGRRIAAEGVTWRTARTFHRDRELFADHLPDAGVSEFPPFVNISQARVEEILDEEIARQPLIAVRWDREVVGLAQDSSGVTIRCAGGRHVRAAYAVACAGARAESVRRALGVTFGGRSFDDRFLICDIRADLPDWAGERRFYFDPAWNPGRQVLIHPCPGGVFRIDWQVPEDYDLAAEQRSGALDERIRAIVGDVGYDVVWSSVYRFHSRVVDRMRVGRVLLAGDCAHLYAPFGARGLNSGVGDADNAAWKLAWVLRGWAGEALLESYHAERHAAAEENLAVTTATMDFLVPHDEDRRCRREAVLTGAASDPGLRGQVDSGRLAEPFWYVASPLTTVDETRPFAGRPPRATVPSPGPGILVPDVPVSVADCTRLRELARSGFLVLAAPEADLAAAEAVLTAGNRRGGTDEGEWTGPLRVLAADDVDPTGSVAAELGMRSGELWVLRPDAYVAAVITDPRDLGPVLRRACGRAATPVR